MKYIFLLLAISVFTLSSCKKQTKTIYANLTWNDNHFVYVSDVWYAAIAESTSKTIYNLSFTQLSKVSQGITPKLSFDISNSKAASHTVIVFNDSNADKKFTADDTFYSFQTVAVSTEKEITIDLNIEY